MRSFVIAARTSSKFWSFVDEIGLPERGSSSAFSQPSLKALCHLKTIFLDRVAHPQASVKEANVTGTFVEFDTKFYSKALFDIFLHRKRNKVIKRPYRNRSSPSPVQFSAKRWLLILVLVLTTRSIKNCLVVLR